MPAKVRGRAACNQCRSRKQKCDEQRPTCSRCRNLDKQCQWPGLRKRGPAKGYTEALEHRLKETENTLLRLLSVIDVATLESAFGDNPGVDITDGQEESRTDKAELAAHWDQFPLSSAQDITKWANEQDKFQSSLTGTGFGLRPRLNEQIAAPFTLPAFERATGSIGELLPSNGAAAVTLGTRFAQDSPDFVQHARDVYNATGLVAEDSRNLEPGDDIFDLPQQFKEKYLW